MKKLTNKNVGGRPTNRKVIKPYLLQAVEIVGGVGELANLSGIHQTSISQWLYTDRQIPAQHVKQIVKATDGKIKNWQLRPDIFEKYE